MNSSSATRTPRAGPGAWTPSPSTGPSPSLPRKPAPFPLLPWEPLVGPLASSPSIHLSDCNRRLPTPVTPPRRKRKLHEITGCLRNDVIDLSSPEPRRDSARSTREDSDEPILLLEDPWRTRPVEHIDPLSRPLPEGSACRLTRYEQKGLGLEATRDIRRGDEILREHPFITFRHPLSHLDIRDQWEPLSSATRALFKTFTATIKDEPDLWVNIAETNCISLSNHNDDDDHEDEDKSAESGWSGLFEFICRINHSCRPNSMWHWDKKSRQLVLLAIEPISRADEVTASYKGGDVVFLSRNRRQAILIDAFGFRCQCRECYDDDNNSGRDARLARYRTIRDRWRADIRDFAFDRGQALAQLAESEKILQELGMESWKKELCAQRLYVHAFWGETELARKAGKRAIKWEGISRGKARAADTEMAAWAEAPESFWGWRLALEDNGGAVSSNDDDDYSDHGRRHQPGLTSRRTSTRSRPKNQGGDGAAS